MNRIGRHFPDFMSSTHRFTVGLHSRLQRALVHALRGRSGSGTALYMAVTDACRELRAAGRSDQSALEMLGMLVEDAGRACGADRPSLLSGELRWMPVRTRVLEHARIVLAQPVSVAP